MLIMANASVSITEEQRQYLKQKNLSPTEIFRKGIILEQFEREGNYNNSLNINRTKNLIEFHEDRINHILKEIEFHKSQINSLKGGNKNAISNQKKESDRLNIPNN